MILYNVTVKIDPDIQEDWLRWMQGTHIPDVMSTGLFLEYRLNRLVGLDESDGITYAVQYACNDMATMHRYQVQHAPRLQEEHTSRYQGKFVAFRTLMEVIDQSR
ncbi:MAG: DUF4286 family protein [Saprospiraceae bacterium]|nr:DUF4286 family protein [Saprospiraceae bacterium]MCB0623506.1 DUF4286 family protein [Saprospiraceae bacterium]MCB0675344.1 DUF4286 family protein [Saprospiraceae bacterium]MCB0682182.1 DUF4286 family protein [Saprospiraceae bacterium]